jgi:HD-like signal output (HDOD) protein
LLHNVGDLVLLTAFPSEYEAACRLAARMPHSSAQRAVFGVNAQLTGRWLLEAWGLPLQFAETTQYWDTPATAELRACPREFLCVVHLAAHLGRCWELRADWQEVLDSADLSTMDEIALGRDVLPDIYEKISEHIGRVQILLD